ncbi:capsular polysaccharide export protein, LipB/KpsS family [Desulfonatronum thiodismutans]|uniref:capsular polysaccharide export protein, LipB/KpsS family n=1 Tax=Desulfonatronum thiodismutans TaxID=159290 RepID=UPI0004ABE5ED|nr:hypothetical protein [Desulfonatronum thiodismutans]
MDKQIQKFIEENEPLWTIRDSDNVALIEGRDLPIQLVTTGIIANILNQRYGYYPTVLGTGERMQAIFKSFGIRSFQDISTNGFFAKKYQIMQACIEVIRLLLCFIFKFFDFNWFISSAKIKGVKIGDLVYDSYVRYGHTYINPWKRMDKLFKILFKTSVRVCMLQYFFANNRVKTVVVTTTVYASPGGVLTRVALKNGVPVIISTGTFARRLTKESDALKSCYHVEPDFLKLIEINPDWKQQIDKYLEDRFSGSILQHDVINAYKDKKGYSRDELLIKLGRPVSLNLPVVFVMPHAFSDAPHGLGLILFRDYYQWYVKTLEHISTIDNILWIVKPHPSSYMYGEDGIAKSVLRKFLTKNVVLCPEDMTTASVFDTADAVVTVQGTIAIEAACMGVPAVLAGDAPFSGYGFTHDPKTREEYFHTLSNINSLKRLADDQMTKARQVLYWYHFNQRPKSQVLPDIKLMPGQTKVDVEHHWDTFFSKLSNSIKKTPFIEDSYYNKLDKFLSSSDSVIEF